MEKLNQTNRVLSVLLGATMVCSGTSVFAAAGGQKRGHDEVEESKSISEQREAVTPEERKVKPDCKEPESSSSSLSSAVANSSTATTSSSKPEIEKNQICVQSPTDEYKDKFYCYNPKTKKCCTLREFQSSNSSSSSSSSSSAAVARSKVARFRVTTRPLKPKTEKKHRLTIYTPTNPIVLTGFFRPGQRIQMPKINIKPGYQLKGWKVFDRDDDGWRLCIDYASDYYIMPSDENEEESLKNYSIEIYPIIKPSE